MYIYTGMMKPNIIPALYPYIEDQSELYFSLPEEDREQIENDIRKNIQMLNFKLSLSGFKKIDGRDRFFKDAVERRVIRYHTKDGYREYNDPISMAIRRFYDIPEDCDGQQYIHDMIFIESRES